MARVLESWPVQARAARYPWDEWLDGRIHELVPGVDFMSKFSTFVANARFQAQRRGGRVRTRSVKSNGEEVLVLQFQRGT